MGCLGSGSVGGTWTWDEPLPICATLAKIKEAKP